ncbi:MAG: acylphosphatase [Gemmatimonadaceae bacterium]|jgi:acylphosphatase|nr:acylphosphatase [Gemmatimonadaceae bacterium]
MTTRVTPPDGHDAAGTLHAIVAGRVQGVGFRWFVRSEARRLGLAGWVRNLDDGTVEVRASGIRTHLVALRGALYRGPEGANVSGITDVDDPPASTPAEMPYPFMILR